MATKANAEFICNMYAKFNARHRARVGRHISELDILLPPIVLEVLQYVQDDDQMASMRASLISRIGNGGDACSFALRILDSSPRARIITHICIRSIGTCTLIYWIGPWFVKVHKKAFGEDPPKKLTIQEISDDQYDICKPNIVSPGVADIIHMFSRCGGRFDEWGNLWGVAESFFTAASE